MSPRSRRALLARDIAVGVAWLLLIATAVAALKRGLPVYRPVLVGDPILLAAVNGVGLALTTALLARRTPGDTPTTPDVLSAPTLVFLSAMWSGPLLAVTALFWWRPGRTRVALLRGAVAGTVGVVCSLAALGLELALRSLGTHADATLVDHPGMVLALFVLGLLVAGAYRGLTRLMLRAADDRPRRPQRVLATVSILASALLVPLSVQIANANPALVVLGTVAVVSLTYAFAVYRASVQDAAAAQTRLLHATIAASDRERSRIAGRIHDGPVQVLVATLMLTEPDPGDPTAGTDRCGALTLDEVRGLLRRAEVELRAISAAAGPGPVVKDLRTSLATSAAALPVDDVRLSWSIPDRVEPESAGAAWPILAEAIRNAVSHGEAGHVQTTVTVSDDGCLTAWVVDDGVGFDVRNGSPNGHLGLALMKERALAAGGRLTLMSEAGEGTVVHLHIPPESARGPVREAPVWVCVYCLDAWRRQFLPPAAAAGAAAGAGRGSSTGKGADGARAVDKHAWHWLHLPHVHHPAEPQPAGSNGSNGSGQVAAGSNGSARATVASNASRPASGTNGSRPASPRNGARASVPSNGSSPAGARDGSGPTPAPAASAQRRTPAHR